MFVHAEDHGWSLSFWEGPELRSRYRCDWDDEIVDQSLDRLLALLEVPPDDDDRAAHAARVMP